MENPYEILKKHDILNQFISKSIICENLCAECKNSTPEQAKIIRRIRSEIKNMEPADVIELGTDYWSRYFKIVTHESIDYQGQKQEASFCIEKRKRANSTKEETDDDIA